MFANVSIQDRIFTDMSIEEYHAAVDCKVAGTWNVHNTLVEKSMKIDFSTMLSSVSGVVGQKGQANYAASQRIVAILALLAIPWTWEPSKMLAI
jgi:hypothetical protein